MPTYKGSEFTIDYHEELSQQLKQLYFHAGRWSGGARDYLARTAYEEYSRRESGNTGKVNLKAKTGRA